MDAALTRFRTQALDGYDLLILEAANPYLIQLESVQEHDG